MDYFACFIIGLVGLFGGLVLGLHIAEAMLLDIQRKLKQLEQKVQQQPNAASTLDSGFCPISGLSNDFLRDCSERSLQPDSRTKEICA
jgi:hypothetical protein